MPVSPALIPFAHFNPEGAEHGLEGLARADNALPLYGGWYAWPSTGTSSNLSGGPILGSYCHTWPAGLGGSSYRPDAITEYHGTEAGLYTYDPALDTWADITRAAGVYAAGALVPAAWRFASFGNDVWAANGVDVPQRRIANAGQFVNGVTSTFVPVPKFLVPLREFMIAAHLNQANRFADEFAWSDVDDPTWYDPADATRTDSLAGSKRIRSARGAITGAVGGDYVIFWKRSSMHSLQFTGGQDIFHLDTISRGIGCPYPGSIVAASDGWNYFRALDGFYRQKGLGEPEPIRGMAWLTGDLEMSPFAISEALPTTMWREDLRVIGVESPSTGLIFWFWKSRAGGVQDDDKKITGACFDTRSQRWGGLLRTSQPEYFSTACSRPVNDQAEVALLWDVVATRGPSSGTNAVRSSFHGTSAHAATLATKKFALSFDEANRGRQVRITGIMPVIGTESVNQYAGPGLLAIPAGTQVKVHRSNDPTFVLALDADGGLVSPITDTADTTQVDEWGYFPVNVEGFWFVVELVFPVSPGFRSLPGVYVRYEVIG
jgi:hypothetical protein